MAVDLERLWSVSSAEPVQPCLLEAMTGLDEKLLHLYRQAPSRVTGRRISTDVTRALESERSFVALQQLTRMAGIALWEREHGIVADSIGL
jgi:hypothetical protein